MLCLELNYYFLHGELEPHHVIELCCTLNHAVHLILIVITSRVRIVFIFRQMKID